MLNITAGSELIRKSFKIAYRAHKDQTDKAGMPYILHILHVAANAGSDESCIAAALLHDTVEDSDMTFEELQKEGIPENIIDALRLLTHKENVPYIEYVKNIRKNEIARTVKMADLLHNMDVRRLNGTEYQLSENDEERVKKYKDALRLLQD